MLKYNLIWLEASGCSGNIISLLNGEAPDVNYFFDEMVKLSFCNFLMVSQGEEAYKEFLEALNGEFILVVEGAISTRDSGNFNIFAKFNGRTITVMEAVKLASTKAKHIIAVGTCASFGGMSASNPNELMNISLDEFLQKKIIKLPGCPCHPDWVMGTIEQLITKGNVETDNIGRPIMFYHTTIHDNCTRRFYFDKGIFAKSLGDKECMFKLGCRGPVTKTDCPTRKWNSYVNWPIGNSSTCIGCAESRFPDGMEPFFRGKL